MSDHYCEFILNWYDLKDKSVRCDAPAGIKHSFRSGEKWHSQWLCPFHYDKIRLGNAKYNASEF